MIYGICFYVTGKLGYAFNALEVELAIETELVIKYINAQSKC